MDEFLTQTMCMDRNPVDDSLYIRRDSSNTVVIALYVLDQLIA